MSKQKIFTMIFLSLLIIVSRLIPHAANFSPIFALALFIGFLSTDWRLRYLPLLALFISDLFLGFYQSGVMLTVYLSLFITILAGQYLKKSYSYSLALGYSLLSAILFFVLTNWAVWFFGTWYSADITGLQQSYLLAIPFFKNTLLSNFVYSTFFFGAYQMYLNYQKNTQNILVK